MSDIVQAIGYRFVFFLLSLRTELNCWTVSDAAVLGVPVLMDQWRRSVLKQCWQCNLSFTGYHCPPWDTEHWLSSEGRCLTWTESSEHSACFPVVLSTARALDVELLTVSKFTRSSDILVVFLIAALVKSASYFLKFFELAGLAVGYQ